MCARVCVCVCVRVCACVRCVFSCLEASPSSAGIFTDLALEFVDSSSKKGGLGIRGTHPSTAFTTRSAVATCYRGSVCGCARYVDLLLSCLMCVCVCVCVVCVCMVHTFARRSAGCMCACVWLVRLCVGCAGACMFVCALWCGVCVCVCFCTLRYVLCGGCVGTYSNECGLGIGV